MACDRVRGGTQVALREQVGVDVVVRDRAVLVGAGDAVDAEAPLRIVVPERAPEPRGLDQQLEPGLELERVVLGRRQIADDGVGDVRSDVEARGACRPVGRAFLAADRAPRERCARKAELVGALFRQ